jgi:hypothetical protein
MSLRKPARPLQIKREAAISQKSIQIFANHSETTQQTSKLLIQTLGSL